MRCTTTPGRITRVAPILDEAIDELGEKDRTAILLRFFEQHDFRSVGQALGVNEDAARMRVNRALEKLQDLIKPRGVTRAPQPCPWFFQPMPCKPRRWDWPSRFPPLPPLWELPFKLQPPLA